MKPLCNHKSRRPGDQSGFTLLEAMIGLMVFTIGVLGMLKFQAVSINANTMAHTSSTNTNEGVAAIERIFALDWDEAGAQPGVAPPEAFNQSLVGVTITTGPAGGGVAIADEKGNPSVRLVTVTSSIVDKGGTQRTTTLRLIKPRM